MTGGSRYLPRIVHNIEHAKTGGIKFERDAVIFRKRPSDKSSHRIKMHFYAMGLSHEKVDTALYHIIPTKNDIRNERYFMIDTILSLSHQ